MASELYFNEQRWRQIGLQDQEIYFLRELLSRSGGSQAVTINLSQAGDMVTNINETMNNLRSEIDRLRHRIQELENGQ